MSFLAKLEVDGEELNVLNCSFRFSQHIDATGKPTSLPKGGTVTMIVESTGNTHLFDWMISPTQTKNGKLTFFRRDANSKLKTLEFSEAHCVDYHEIYDHAGDHPMQIQLMISALELKLNDSEYKNNWPS
ncbi:MAG: type VI secretion system tube protein TssD [Agriterribacter sp.]